MALRLMAQGLLFNLAQELSMETPLNILTHWQLLSVLFATLFAASGLTLWKQGFFSKEPRRFFLGTLRPTQVKMLKEAQIPFEEGLFLGQAGVLVKAQNRDRALQALHATLTATGERGRKEEKTADAQRLTLAFADGQPLHTINFVGRFPVHPIRIAAAVSEWLVPLVERDVVVWGLDAEGPQGPDDGKFHLIPGTYLEPQGDSQAGNVYLKSWPRINWHYQEQGVMDIWSATLPTMLASRLPKPQAVQLPAEYSGFYPLEMQDNKLYFLFDVLAQDNEHIGWFARRQRRSARQGRDIYLDLFALGLKKFSSEINAERRIQDCIKEAGVTEPAVRAILRSKDDAPAGTTHIEVKVQNLLGSQEQIRRPAVLAELARQILGPLCSRSITIVKIGRASWRERV